MNAPIAICICITVAVLPYPILVGCLIRRRQRADQHIARLGELIVTARAHPEKNAAVWVDKAEELLLRAEREFYERTNYVAGYHYLHRSENALRSAASVPPGMIRADRGKVTIGHLPPC